MLNLNVSNLHYNHDTYLKGYHDYNNRMCCELCFWTAWAELHCQKAGIVAAMGSEDGVSCQGQGHTMG